MRATTYSQQSGWLVSTTVPEAIANRPIVHSWALVATLAVSFTLLVGAARLSVRAQDFRSRVRALVEGARALGRGEPVAPINSSIREVRAVGEALAKASETRRRWSARCAKARIGCGLALASADTGTWDWDLKSGTLTWDQRMRELWGLGPDDPVTFDIFVSALNPLDRESTLAAIEKAQDAGEPVEYDVEHRVNGMRDGVERWVAANGRAHFADGVPVRMTGTARDITDRKRWEEHIQLLMREVTHRSKNLLAVIQAMARQTKARQQDVADFEVRFSGRLQALAASHDLLGAARLARRVDRRARQVAARALSRPAREPDRDRRAEDDRHAGGGAEHRSRRPRAVDERGQVRRAFRAAGPRRGALDADRQWQRRCPPSDELDREGRPRGRLPSHKGFGQVVTEQLTARALQGEANLIFDRGGVSWTLDIPAVHILAQQTSAAADTR